MHLTASYQALIFKMYTVELQFCGYSIPTKAAACLLYSLTAAMYYLILGALAIGHCNGF